MAGLKLKKISWMRRRFMRSEALSNLDNWSDTYEEMKQVLLKTSAFQQVGQIGIVEINSKNQEARVLVEVVGVPRAGVQTEDHDPREVLVFDCPEGPFDVDFLTLKAEAEAIIGGIQRPLDSRYHIVFDGDHLALHFFI